MPKNRSGKLRAKARRLAAAENISHAEALRRLNSERHGIHADAVSTDATVNWLLSTTPGGLTKTTAPFPNHLVKTPPPPSRTVSANALLAALRTISDTPDCILIDIAPSETTSGYTHRADVETSLADLGQHINAQAITDPSTRQPDLPSLTSRTALRRDYE